MKRHAYIFVSRNMGNGYAYAYPPMNSWRAWALRTFILPCGNAALAEKEKQLSQDDQQTQKTQLAQGIFVFAARFGYTVCAIKIVPDELCPDPKARGRSPRFVMYAVMDGFPELFSKKFNMFINECRRVSLETFKAGANPSLLLEIPDHLYPPRT